MFAMYLQLIFLHFTRSGYRTWLQSVYNFICSNLAPIHGEYSVATFGKKLGEHESEAIIWFLLG